MRTPVTPEQALIWQFALKCIEEFRKCAHGIITKEMCENIIYCQAKIPPQYKREMAMYLGAEKKFENFIEEKIKLIGVTQSLVPSSETAIPELDCKPFTTSYIGNTSFSEASQDEEVKDEICGVAGLSSQQLSELQKEKELDLEDSLKKLQEDQERIFREQIEQQKRIAERKCMKKEPSIVLPIIFLLLVILPVILFILYTKFGLL